MKLKRFVAIVISLAMVLSIVPAFSLTAFAGDYTSDELISMATYTFDGSASNGQVNGGGSDINISNISSPDHWTGWSSSWGGSNVTDGSGTNVNIIANSSDNYIQVYGAKVSEASKGATVTTSSAVQTGTADKDYWIFEFAIGGSSGNEHDYGIYDTDGDLIESFRHLSGAIGPFYADNAGGAASFGSGQMFTGLSYTYDASSYWWDCGGADYLRLVFENDEDGDGYTVAYYTSSDGSSYSLNMTKTYATGNANGFGKYVAAPCNGSSGWWTNTQIKNPKIYAGDFPAASKTIEVTYTVGGTTVKTESKTIDTSVTSTASFDAYYYSVNGENTMYYAAAQTLSDSATIAMTALENHSDYAVGLEFALNGTPYVVKSANLIPNGNFEYGLNGWYGANNGTLTTSNFSVNGDGTVTSLAGKGTNDAGSLMRAWAIEDGKTYVFAQDNNGENEYHKFALTNTINAEDYTILGKDSVQGNNATGTSYTVFTNDGGYAYAQIKYRWTTSTFGNFGLYEVEVDESRIANTTIKFVDSSNTSTELQTAVTVTGVVGDTITIADYAPSTITYNGNPYSLDSSNVTTYTVAGNNDVVTLTYTTDAYVSFTADPITVIAGNDPVMPTTVTAVTGAGATTVVDGATFTGYTGLAAGTHTINGTVTVEGTTINGSVEVTVLPMTFEVEDFSSNTTTYFPVDVTGDFYVEFDYNASNLDNMWIYISANGAQWGSGQIGLGWDANGNGYFRAQPADQTDIVFETNKDYRFLVHGNVDTDTYDLTVYDTVTKAVVFTCDDYGFRSGSDMINSIFFSSNGEGGVATLSNIKVYAPDQASLFTTYNVVVTGSVSDSYTTTATSVNTLEIPYYPGNIFSSRSVSGTTVTYTYEASEDTLGTWAIRNNVTNNSWISEMKYLGTHNSFADNDSPERNDGGALSGVTGATTTGAITVSASQTQTAGALDQLNWGVRYFDLRLTRQEDGTFWSYHGPAFSNFNLYAHTIGQWLKEHPGEVVILDFHENVDGLYGGSADGHYEVITDNDAYYGANEGDDNQYYYDALKELLIDAGIWDMIPTNSDQKYGALTNNGTKSVVIAPSKPRGANCLSGKFVNRNNWTSGDTTYVETSSIDTVRSTFETAISNGTFGSGARFGTLHAYVTPTTGLISAANTANAKWTEDEVKSWMKSGYGDIFMINNVTEEFGLKFVEWMSEINRDYMDGQLGDENSDDAAYRQIKSNDVVLTGATTSVPYSTEFVAEPTAASGTYTIDGVTYTANTAYDIDLLQFDTTSTALTGDVTVTFPKVSADTTTVDAILSSDGSTVLATAGVGEAVAITTSSLADVILVTRQAPGYEYTVNYVAGGTTICSTTELVAFGEVVYSVPAGDFYLAANGEAYILNSQAASSHTAASTDTVTTFDVPVTVVSDNAVLYDTFANADGSADCNNTSNQLFIGSNGVSNIANEDADGASTTTRGDDGVVGNPRIPLLTFNVPTVADGQAVKFNVYVADANHNINSGGSMKLAVNTANVVVDEALGYKAADVANQEGLVWADAKIEAPGSAADGRIAVNSWVTFDVTDFVKAATGDTITFALYAPTAGAYAIDREKAVAGGAYAGKAAYMEVVDAYTVTVGGASKITRNGNLVDATDSVVAYEGAQVKFYETSSATPAFTNGTKVYATDNTTGETPYITVTGADEYFAATVGVAPVDGAQVRIGDGVNADGKVDGTNSGLRFITTVNRDNSLATVTGATFGVEITAEGSSAEPVVIPADKWQSADVYTSALTNLAVGNFNRKFTATPYVTVDGQTFYGTPVTRSIYQVAAGLLTTGSVDGTEYPDEALSAKTMIDVLNAYVNQTGIRLTLADTNADETADTLTARTEGTGAYSGNAFFTVSDTVVDGTKYTVTLTPVGENTEINMNYWNTYVRINNNNSQTAVATTLTDNGDGTYTLTFDTSAVAEKAE